MDSTTPHLVGVAIPTLKELRSVVLASVDPESAVNALREAGYAGGDAVYEAFEQWLAETRRAGGPATATDLPLDEFWSRVAAFFLNAGWGEVTFTHDEAGGVAMVDISHCWEGDATGDAGCQVTTGLLASFFGRVAGYPVAVLETECSAGSASSCRFLMGNQDVMNHEWKEIQGQRRS